MNTILKTYKVLILLVFLLAYSINISAQFDIFTEQDQIKTSSDSTKTNKPIELSDLNKEIEYTDNLITKFNISNNQITTNKELVKHSNIVNKYILKQGKEFFQFNMDNLSHYFLVNANYTWVRYYKELRKFQDEIQSQIRKNQYNQNKFNNNVKKWETNLPRLKNNISSHINQRIRKNLIKSKKIIKEYDKGLKSLLEIENNIIENIVYVERILSTIEHYTTLKRKNIFAKTDKSIFTEDYKNSYSGSIKDRFALAYYENTKTFGYFAKKIQDSIYFYSILLLIISFSLLFLRKKYINLNYDENTVGFKNVERILINKVFYIILSFALLLWTIIIPFTPLFINNVIYLLILISLLMVMSDLFDKQSKRITLVVIALLMVNNLEMFAWYFGNYARIYLLFESSLALFFISPFIINIFNKDKANTKNKTLSSYFNKAAIFISILFVTGFIANIIGTTNLAIYILSFSAKYGTVTIIAYSFSRIFKSILQAILDVTGIKYPELVNNYGEKIKSKGNKIINTIMTLSWGYGILQISEILTYFDAQFMDILTSGITVGDFSFTFGSILLFFGILYFAVSLNKFIKNILEREVLVKKELKRGSAAAISLTARILILFLGITLALSASGIDMTKISIIAGALSVGIGFGLQNIVSNFVSGLILVYERPLQEGDTIEVGNLLGRVTNIGVRASNILTYDGAEVIVPNTNLVSNELINWTLSDKKKRQHVTIGVKYGTDPNLVLQLLTEVCNEHPKVLPSPAPLPLFTGFGDSSLDFKLLFWVSFEDGLQTKSDINVAINNALKEHNIEIPFPQVDLHVKDILGKEEDEEEEIKAIEEKANKKDSAPKLKPQKALDGDGV